MSVSDPDCPSCGDNDWWVIRNELVVTSTPLDDSIGFGPDLQDRVLQKVEFECGECGKKAHGPVFDRLKADYSA